MAHDLAATTGWAGSASLPLARDSAVVVELDRTLARALLFDIVDGVPRFVGLGVSPTSVASLRSGAGEQIVAALHRLEDESGRRFLEQDALIAPQRTNGDGADAYYLTGVPLESIRVALIAASSGTLGSQIAAGIRQTQTVMAEAREDLLIGQGGFSAAALERWFWGVRPEAVILVDEGGAPEDWDIALEATAAYARAAGLEQGVVVASETQQQLAAQALGPLVELSGIDPAHYQTDDIIVAVEAEFRDQYLRRIEGHSAFPLLAQATFVERIQALQAVAAFLFRRMGRSVLALSLGDGALLHYAGESGGVTVARAEYDLALNSRALLRTPPSQLARWLPMRWSDDEITQWILNRSLRPFTSLQAISDRFMAAAAAREILALLTRDAGLDQGADIDLIALGPGPLGDDPALAVLTVLDGVLPNSADGIVSIAHDVEGLMAAAGAIASDDPGFAREVVEQDVLTPLATCIVVTGQGEDGELAVRGQIEYAGGETRHFSVPYGSLHLLPLGEGESAQVVVTAEPGFQIGRAGPGETASFTGERQVFGGRVGVIIDARGRPARLPQEPDARIARLREWMNDLGGQLE
ncbi:MAG TPA: hypothetical protein VFI42_09625 [Thermomicrobiaceae bacterium]|nr:hypothetical protein [Thermomicrobiaceae bacterium]